MKYGLGQANARSFSGLNICKVMEENEEQDPDFYFPAGKTPSEVISTRRIVPSAL